MNLLLLFGTQFHLPPFCELFDFQDLCFLIFQIIEYRHFALTSIQIIVSEEFNRNLTSDDGLSIVFYLARKHGQGPRVQPVSSLFVILQCNWPQTIKKLILFASNNWQNTHGTCSIFMSSKSLLKGPFNILLQHPVTVSRMYEKLFMKPFCK